MLHSVLKAHKSYKRRCRFHPASRIAGSIKKESEHIWDQLSPEWYMALDPTWDGSVQEASGEETYWRKLIGRKIGIKSVIASREWDWR